MPGASLPREKAIVRARTAAFSLAFEMAYGSSLDSAAEALKESLQFLKEAEAVFKVIHLYKALQDTQFLLATVYHNLAMEKERDAASGRCLATEDMAKKAAAVSMEDWQNDVWDVVSKVGAVIAAKT